MKQIFLLFGLSIFYFWFIPKDNTDSTTTVSYSPKPTSWKLNVSLVDKNNTQKDVSLVSPGQVWRSPLAANITAVKSVSVEGGGNAVLGGQLNYSIVVSNTATGEINNATGVVFTDILNSNLTLVSGSIKATPIALDDNYSVVGNVGIVVNAASGLLTNDISPTNTSKTATAVTNGTSTNGTYSIATDGSFTYTPNVGYVGNDTFTYTINTGTTSSTGTVNITVSGMIWFVNAAVGSSGSGTLASPFKNISNITGTATGNTIFVYEGTYTGSLTLLGTQKLIGQGATTSLATITGLSFTNAPSTLPATGGTNPTWNTASLTLGSGNDVQGINLNSTSGTTMTGASVGALKVRDVSLANTAGQALQITAGGALNVVFKSISAAGAAKGISVNSATGSFEVTGTGTTAGSGGTINNITSKGAEFSSASNITLRNMNFTNSSSSDASLSASDYSVSNGGILANGVTGITLNNVSVTGSSQRGIAGHNVSNLSITNCTVNNSGNNVNEGAIAFSNLSGTCSISGSTITRANEHLINIFNTNVNLNLSISNSNISDTQTTPTGTASSIVGTGILSNTFGTGKTYIIVSNCTLNKIGTDAIKTINNDNSIGSYEITGCSIDPVNSVTQPNDVGTAIEITSNETSTVYTNIHSNTKLSANGGNVVTIAPTESSIIHSIVNNNQVTYKSGGISGLFRGIEIFGQNNARGYATITNNVITGIPASHGIMVDNRSVSGDAGNGRIDANISSNTITHTYPDPNSSGRCIFIEAGNSTTLPANTICARVASNTTITNGVNGHFRLSSYSPGSILLEGNTDATTAWNGNNNSPLTTNGGIVSVRSGSTVNMVAANTCVAPSSPPAFVALLADINQFAEKNEEENRLTIIESKPNEILDFSEALSLANPESLKDKNKDINIEGEQNSIADINAGETVTINGSGTGFLLPAGKSTTITFSATISNTPSTCEITNTAQVSGSNFTTLSSNTTTSNIVIPAPTSVTSATSICFGQSISLSATCQNGTVQWYNLASPNILIGTSNSGESFIQSPTINTTYQSACKVNGCESSRTNTGLITVNPLPTITVGDSPAICEGASSFAIPFTGTTGTPTTYSLSGIGITTVTNATLPTSPITVNLGSAASGSSYAYVLTVQNSNGCVSNIVNGSVNVNPTPTITTQTGIEICAAATSFTIPYTATTGLPTSYSISGIDITTVTNGVLTSSPITVNLNSGASGSTFSYNLTVTNEGGCSSNQIIGSVTVNDLPTLTKSASPPICVGATSFTIPYTGTTGSPNTYSISGIGITSVTNAVLPSSPITVNLNGGASGSEISYVLTVKNGNECISTNIEGSVTINALPESNPSSDSPKCVGTTLSLSSNGGMSNYSWTGPNLFSSSDQNPSISNVSVDASGTYSLTVTNANGCTASATSSVTINALPVANPSSDSPKCVGTTLAFNSVSGMSTYAWTGPNLFSSSDQNPSISNVSVDASGTYSLTVTNASGCTASATTSVTINALPVANPSSDSPKCAGTTLAFNSVSGMSTYSWTGPNSFTSDIQNPSINNVSTDAAGTYSLTVTNASGCTASATTVVAINASPVSNPISDSPKCVGTTLSLSSNGGMSIYSWTGPNLFSSSDQNPSISNVPVEASGTYSLTVTNANGCTASATTEVVINAIPTAPIASDQNVCFGSNVTLIANCATGSHPIWATDVPGVYESTVILNNVTSDASYQVACERDDMVGCFSVFVPVEVKVNSSISYIAINSEFNNVYACENGAAFVVLNNSIVGGPLNIQWQLDNGSGFSNIAISSSYGGVNDDTLKISNITTAMNNYRYRAIVSNVCNVIVTDTSTLKVNQLPTIINQPLGQTVCVGNQTTLTVAANGSGLSYQWEINTGSGFINITNNLNYSGVNSPNLLITNIQNGFNNNQYRCRIFNQCQSINSNPVTLMVDPTITILTQPTNKSICQNANTTFNILAVNTLGGSIAYQWQRQSGSAWVNLSNAGVYSGVTSSALSITGATANLSGVNYRCVINGYCQSQSVSLSVIPVATITSQPVAVNICVGNNASFSVTAAGINLTYRWQINTGSGFVNLFDGGIYQGATTNTLLLDQPGASVNGYLYRCVVTGNGSCDVTPATSNSALLSIGTAAEAQTIVAVSPISSGSIVYQAVQVVLGLNTITAPAKVEYRAGNSILLNPGFLADAGAVFTAKIQNPCNSSVNFQTNNNSNLPREIKK